MQVWTNDECVAGVHRVVPVERDRSIQFALFLSTKNRLSSGAWPMKDKKALYRSFTWRDYITGRVTDNLQIMELMIFKYPGFGLNNECFKR